jgi:hypothetical protein
MLKLVIEHSSLLQLLDITAICLPLHSGYSYQDNGLNKSGICAISVPDGCTTCGELLSYCNH